jgi:hypothetical protein
MKLNVKRSGLVLLSSSPAPESITERHCLASFACAFVTLETCNLLGSHIGS